MSWLKVETHTPDKPEIAQIARLCECSKAHAFLAFFKFYAYADQMTEDGRIELLQPEDADEYAGLKGFGKALEEVCWAKFNPGGCFICNWERHNGKSAKRRLRDAERKRQQRGEPDND